MTMTKNKKTITVESVISAPVKNVWEFWTKPEHITHWNNASPDWHTPRAENDVCIGGKFLWRMEAKDGSAGFDFNGTYTNIKKYELIEYTIEGGRQVKIQFSSLPEGIKLTETFEIENVYPEKVQRAGWQAILDNFKKYVEGRTKRVSKNNMQKIIPHLWFDKEAKEAVELYVSIFPNSKVTHTSTIHGVPTPTGDCDIISFELANQPFMAINAGPAFKFNPSISFFLNFDPSRDAKARENLDVTWEKLSQGGKVLMPLQEYPFSKHYGWVQDKYGISWQLILTNPEGEERPFIVPSLLFAGSVCGKAEEATNFYMSVFKDSKRGLIARYPKGMEPDKEGTIMFTDFMLSGQWLAAMDSARSHDFVFNEAVSLLIPCESQEEIDYYWGKLSADPKAEQCGWLKDKYGVSWQVWPTAMGEMMSKGTREQVDRVTQAFLPMKKFDIAKLKQAYGGK